MSDNDKDDITELKKKLEEFGKEFEKLENEYRVLKTKSLIDNKTLLYVNATIITGLFILLTLVLQPYVNAVINTNTNINSTNNFMDRFKDVVSNDPILRSVNSVVIGIVFFIGSSIAIIINEISRDGISFPKAFYLYLSSRMLTCIGFLYLVGSSF